MDLGLRDRACIVTGASAGIGRATAVVLAAEGAAVLLVGRREDALADGGRALPRGRRPRRDARARHHRARRRRAAAPTRAWSGSAGSTRSSTTPARARSARSSELTDEDWQAQWELHVMVPMRLMRAVAPVMADRGWGRIVNVSSSSGKRPAAQHGLLGDEGGGAVAVPRVRRPVRRVAGCSSTPCRRARSPTSCGSLRAGWPTRSRARGASRREQVLESIAGADPARAARRPSEEIAAVIAFLCSERGVERRRRRVVGRRRHRARDHLRDCRRAWPSNRRDRQDLPGPSTYAVGREKIREYAAAVGETNPLHFDVEAARAAGYADVVAPPMFAVVYAARAVGPAIFDPEVGINFAMMVHARPGVRVGTGRRRRRRDHDDRVGQGHLRPRRDGVLRVRVACPRTSAARPSAPAPGPRS